MNTPNFKKVMKRDKIYGLVQNSISNYGSGIKIMELVNLTKPDCEEFENQYISLNWSSKIIGIHTKSRKEKLTVIDTLHKMKRT